MSAVKRVEISASFKNESVVKTILLITEKFHEKRLKRLIRQMWCGLGVRFEEEK